MKTAAQYISQVYGLKTFERALELKDTASIMDLMEDYASEHAKLYANQKLDEAAEIAEWDNQDSIERQILSLKDEI